MARHYLDFLNSNSSTLQSLWNCSFHTKRWLTGTLWKKIEKSQNIKATWFNRFSALVLTLLWKCSGNLTRPLQLLVTNTPVRSTVKFKIQRRVLYLHKTHKFLLSKQTQHETFSLQFSTPTSFPSSPWSAYLDHIYLAGVVTPCINLFLCFLTVVKRGNFASEANVLTPTPLQNIMFQLTFSSVLYSLFIHFYIHLYSYIKL